MAVTSSPLRTSWASIRGQRGQTLVEYGLILTFISVLAIGVLSELGSRVKGTFSTVNSQLSSGQTGGASAPANNHPGG